ncbi:hypothetical protein P5673_031078 [Acropora cervicornis]|uniref:Uncharacterized protein n=1 Tax=Acropora cervicornis TaxID=6130 RepID=A0AAD9UT64_ACRCE|nr:hypothetical protein P5673_031078 [Acropora cervicornis]
MCILLFCAGYGQHISCTKFLVAKVSTRERKCVGVAVDRENGTQNRHLVVLWKTSLWKLCLDELGLVNI